MSTSAETLGTDSPVSTAMASSGTNTQVTFSSADLANALAQSSSVTARIPPFWTNSPEAWFVQAEAQFELSRINKEERKYAYLVSSLPQEVIQRVLDVIQNPPNPNERYKTLKAVLLQRFSLSEEGKITNLLYHEEIGDRSPSEFYHRLLLLAGNDDSAKTLAIKLWKDRLPSPIDIAVIPLMAQGPTVFLDTADKIWERTRAKINTVSNNPFLQEPSTSNYQEPWKKDIESLKACIEKLSENFYSNRGRSKSSNRSHSKSRDSEHKRNKSHEKLCWYHKKFGDKARKCVKPCSYDNNTKN